MRRNIYDDTQQALSFLVQQASYIEPQVYRIKYPDIQYPSLIPVDTSANEWAKSVTFFSMDRVGAADWFAPGATDMRVADVNRAMFEQGIEMAGIGYRYNLAELGASMLTPGTNLSIERAASARRAAEEFTDKVAFSGNHLKGWSGLLNNTSVTRVDAAPVGTGSSRYWDDKDGDQMVADVNDALTGVYTGSLTVEMADTVLLPIAALAKMSNTRMSNTFDNALTYLKQNNIYTQMTGAPLTVRGVIGLDTAGNAGTGRMICYRKDPMVIKMHIPMTHRFLPVWQTGPITFDIPGIFRLGGIEIRRPGSVRYVDYVTAAP